MIKFIMCLTRHPSMSREAFRAYWQGQHGPFFVKNADTLGAKKYVQSYTLQSPVNQGLREAKGLQPEYDGIAEVWFESEQALIEGMSSPEGEALVAALQEDESNFIDHTRSAAFIVQEHGLL